MKKICQGNREKNEKNALRPPSWPCRDSRLMTRSGFLAPCLRCRRADSDERGGPLNGPLVPCQPCWRADSDERVGPLNGPPRVGFPPHGSESGNRVSAPCSRLAGPSPATACQLPAPTSRVRVQQPGAVRLSTLWYLIRPSSETLSAPCSRLAGPSPATACRLPAPPPSGSEFLNNNL